MATPAASRIHNRSSPRYGPVMRASRSHRGLPLAAISGRNGPQLTSYTPEIGWASPGLVPKVAWSRFVAVVHGRLTCRPTVRDLERSGYGQRRSMYPVMGPARSRLDTWRPADLVNLGTKSTRPLTSLAKKRSI